jgi:hypothetical protein
MQNVNVVFIHIEKAGGTTLNDFFLENLAGYWVMPPKKMEYGWRYDSRYLRKLRKVLRFKHVGGHQIAAFKQYEDVFPNPFYVSFIREPVDRFLSHVNWRTKQEVATDLERFVSNERTLNQQCFRICGERAFAPAKRLIETKPYFIGITEMYVESMFILQRMLGLHQAPFQNSNVTKSQHKKFSSSDLDPAQLERLRGANAEDVKLYDWIVSELFDKQKAQVDWSESHFEEFNRSVPAYHRPATFDFRKKLKAGFARLATSWLS